MSCQLIGCHPPPPTNRPPHKNKKKKRGAKKEYSTPNERAKDEKDEKLAVSFLMDAATPNHSYEVTVTSTGEGVRDTLDPDDPPCDGCNQPNFGTKKCGRCSSAFYCSRECQVSHWSAGHKRECRQHQKRNEEVAERVLHTFKDVRCWKDLDATGAYNAAVLKGLNDKIREVLELDKTKIVDRHLNGRGIFYVYVGHVMGFLFRGQRAEGRNETSSRSTRVASMDGVRIEQYVKSHPRALDAWLQASVQLLRDITDPITLRYPDQHRYALESASEVWTMWVMLFLSDAAARAVLSPFPGTDVDDGGSADQRHKRGEAHVRALLKTLGVAFRLVFNNWDPDPNLNIFLDVCMVCALVHVRAQECGFGIDLGGILNLGADDMEVFTFIEIPKATRMIEKGTILNEQETRVVLAEGARLRDGIR